MDSIARRMVLTAKAMRAHFEAELAAAGASLPFWLVLRELHGEDGLSQRELARRLSVEAPTLTRHIDRMAADGLLVRQQDDADRRVTRILLTRAGRAMHDRLVGVGTRLEADVRGLMSDRDYAVVSRVLSRIDTYLETADADVG